MKKINIAFDGPAASGKSEISKRVAKKLGYLYIDTGAMYRAITLLAAKKGVLNSKQELIAVAEQNRITLKPADTLKGYTVEIAGEDVTDDLTSSIVNENVSAVSKIPEVRALLVAQQQQIAKDGGTVMAGRDITTVVIPDAELKIYLDASVEERAKRRYNEMRATGEDVKYEAVLESLKRRDKIDSERDVSPLKIAPDAKIVDSDNKGIEEVVAIVLKMVGEIC